MKNNRFTRSQITLIKVAIVLIILIIIYGGNLIYKTIQYESVEVIPLDTTVNEPGVYDVEGLSDEEVDEFINNKRNKQGE